MGSESSVQPAFDVGMALNLTPTHWPRTAMKHPSSNNGTRPTTHEAAVDAKVVEYALKSLDRWREINDGHHSQKRSLERFSFRGRPIVVVEDVRSSGDELGAASVGFEVWGRNVSRGGASFLSGGHLVPCGDLDDDVSLMSLEDVIELERVISIGFCYEKGFWQWFLARVMRVRKVHGGLFEIGVAFTSRE